MLCYRDRTFCADPCCVNKCGRKLSREDRIKAEKLGLPIAYASFCYVPDDVASDVGKKVMERYAGALEGLKDK